MSSAIDLNMEVEQAFRSVWPAGDTSIRDYLTPAIVTFAQSNCRDNNYLKELKSGDLAKMAARIWEAMLAKRIKPSFAANHPTLLCIIQRRKTRCLNLGYATRSNMPSRSFRLEISN